MARPMKCLLSDDPNFEAINDHVALFRFVPCPALAFCWQLRYSTWPTVWFAILRGERRAEKDESLEEMPRIKQEDEEMCGEGNAGLGRGVFRRQRRNSM